MKILYFILGSFKEKFEQWGLNSFDDLLKEDIVFFGPIKEDKFEYNSKEYKIIKFFNEISIFEVFNQLPDNWYPDILHCDTSVLNYISDIYQCPVKTCLFTADAWADTVYNRKLVNFFDYTRYSIIDKEEYTDEKTYLLSTANVAVSIPGKNVKPKEFSKRKIDVLAIANYNSGFYHERFKILFRAARSLNSKYRIEFRVNLTRQEVHYYYQNSKIVLDWSHTPSNRSYEAALNGCLLFSHEKNKRISEIWTPWIEYIPYNEDNLEILIEDYLNNPEKANAGIRNSQNKLKNLPFTWGKVVLAQLKEAMDKPTSITERIARIEKMPKEIYYHCLATPFFYNYQYNTNYPINWREIYFTRINKALSFDPEIDSKFLILLDACRMSFVLKQYDKCMEYLKQLEGIKPSYAWIYYLRGRIQKHNGNFRDAMKSFDKALNHGLDSPSELKQYFLPYIEKGNASDIRRLTNYIWHSALRHNNEYQVKALFHMTYEQMGDVSVIEGKNNEAITFFQKAIQILPIQNCIYKLNNLLIQTKEYSSIIEAADLGLKDNPYDTRLVLEKANALLNVGNKLEYKRILKNHRGALKSFKQDRRMKLRRIILLIHCLLPILGYSLAKKIGNSANRLMRKYVT